MIANYKDWVVDELENWALTFVDEVDSDGEPTSKPYDTIMKLCKNYRKRKFKKKDYENILFHLWQIKAGDE